MIRIESNKGQVCCPECAAYVGVLLPLLLAFVLHASLTRAADGQDNAALRDFVLTGVVERAHAFKSGRFSATGYRVARSTTPDGKTDELSGRVIIRGAYDLPERIRFDLSQPAYQVILPESTHESKDPASPGLRVADKVTLGAGEFRQHPSESFLIRDKNRFSYWINGQLTVYITAKDEIVPNDIRPFDVQAVGLYGWLEYSRELSVEELVAAWKRRANVLASEIESGVWKLAFPSENSAGQSTWEVEIDTKRGFTPRAARLLLKPTNGGPSEIAQASEALWEQVNGAWIPLKFSIIAGKPHSRTYRRIALTLEWASVNEPVDPELFSYESFPTPQNVAIVDSTLSHPVILRGYGLKGREASQYPGAMGQNKLLLVIIFNAILSAGLLLYVFWWRRRGWTQT